VPVIVRVVRGVHRRRPADGRAGTTATSSEVRVAVGTFEKTN
jgi:hypothetical protein